MLPLLLFATALAAKYSVKVESCLRVLAPDLAKCNTVEEKCRVLAKDGSQCLSDAKPEQLIELMHSLNDGACLQYNLVDLHLSKRDEAAAAPEYESDQNVVNRVVSWAKERQIDLFDISDEDGPVAMPAAYSDKYAPDHDKSGLGEFHLPGIIGAAGVVLLWVLL